MHIFRCCYHLVRFNPCSFRWRSFFHYSFICTFRWRSFFHYSFICIFRWLFGLLRWAWDERNRILTAYLRGISVPRRTDTRPNPCIFKWQERSQDGLVDLPGSVFRVSSSGPGPSGCLLGVFRVSSGCLLGVFQVPPGRECSLSPMQYEGGRGPL